MDLQLLRRAFSIGQKVCASFKSGFYINQDYSEVFIQYPGSIGGMMVDKNYIKGYVENPDMTKLIHIDILYQLQKSWEKENLMKYYIDKVKDIRVQYLCGLRK